MAKYKFVGFQEHVEIPKGFEKIEISEEITFSVQDVFSYLSNPALLSKWFYPIKSLDAKASGKIEFEDSKIEGICVAADLGRAITLLSDQFGEFSAHIKGYTLNISFKILTDNPEEKKSEISSLINSLKKLIS